MNQRYVIILAIVISLSFIGMLAGIYSVVKLKPTWVGLPPNPQDTVKVNIDTTIVKPTIEITPEDYEKYKLSRDQIKYLMFQKDSLIQTKIKLMDSLVKVFSKVTNSKQETKRITDSLNKTKKDINWLQDTLRKITDNYSKTIRDKDILQKRVKDQDKFIENKVDSAEIKNFTEYAHIFSSTNPADVAKILEELDERDAARILKTIPKKKASKILESMKTQKAVAILLLGAEKK